MSVRIRHLSQAMAAFALACLVCNGAAAQETGSWGKEMSIYIGSTPGGGYDQYGRLLGRHMSRHLPNEPKLIPRNIPNARQLMAHIYNIAPRDGSAIAITTRNTIFDPLLHDDDFKFDAVRLTWIGSMNSETSLCVAWHTATATSIEQMKATTTIFGSGGPSTSDFHPRQAAERRRRHQAQDRRGLSRQHGSPPRHGAR